jgi:Icc protein
MESKQRPKLRVIQVSDCHVSADPDARYRGQNANEGLAGIVRAAQQLKPRLVIVTGDVSEDGSWESYKRTAGLLAQIAVPVMALPGNHDDVELMSRYFPAGPWSGPYLSELDDWQLILLDSTAPGRISGSFSTNALEQLQDVLQASRTKHSLVALHHQPVPVGASWIDRYALEAPEQFFNVIDQVPGTRCIAWGHVHHDFRARRKGISLLGAPSSVANSLPETERFSLDPAGPACRWLELSADGGVDTGILYAS